VSDTVRAADLPEGSTVATDRKAFIKNHPTLTAPWRGTDGGYHGDWSVQKALDAGAQVLRVGDGTDHQS
jgi:hypothetical protein